jgi:glycosyltransferase involved in cell wall biosynthesis
MKLLYQSFEIINLFKNANVPIGGAAVEWFVWSQAFKKIGCDFGLLTWKGAKKTIKKEVNIDFVESYELDKGIPKIRLLTYRIPSFYKAIKRYNPDYILQGCATENTGILAFLAKLLGKPFIHRVGSDMDVDGRIARTFSKLSLAVYHYGIKNASHISCQNQYQYNILKKKYPNKSISILHNPYFYKKQHFNNNNKEYIAWVGNFRYEKNLPALAAIAEKLPQYSFKIAGIKFYNTDEDTLAGLKKLQSLSNVEFIGYLNNDDIPEFLNNAYCLLNTSRLEGFSNTFLEAWAVGIPVVSTKNVNPDNIITDYKLGIITEKYEHLVNKIDNLITNKEYEEYSNRCIDYVKKKHDPLKLAKQFLDEMINCISLDK